MATSSSFRAHRKGLFRPQHDDAQSDNNIYVTRVKGPFDIQAIDALGRTRFTYLSGLDNKKIPTIVAFQGSMYVTPEALTRFGQILKQQLEQFRKTFIVAFVAPEDIEGREKYCQLFKEIYSTLNVPWRDFEEIDDANAWIKSLMDQPQRD